MMKQFYLATLIVLIYSTETVAQQIDISGKIIDARSEPIENATVRLLTEDSVFIKGGTTDTKGMMKLKADANRNYRLAVSAMGYLPVMIHVEAVKEHLSLGDIMMSQSTVDLDSITVTANRIVHKIDRQITYPSPLTRKSSNNALDLLSKMALPRVLVNPAEKSISMIGNGSIRLRINGVDAEVNEIMAIPAGEIVRVDYYDNPGVRIKESAMIDFIVKRRTSGGYVSTDLTNSPHVGFGNDQFAFKSNYKNSEWGAFYNLSYRSYKKRETQTTTEYLFPDESFVQQTVGIPSPFHYQTHQVNLNYNYTLPEKRVVNVIVSGAFHNNKGHDRFINYYSDKSGIAFPSKIETGSKEKNPELDLYYKEELAKNQTLYVNIVSGYIDTDYSRYYQEEDQATGQMTLIDSRVAGKKYSVIGEADHQVRWKNMSLYSGVNYKLGHAKNEYGGTITENTSLNNSEVYLYSQLQGRLKKLSYTAGLGVAYSYFSDYTNKYRFWTFKPELSLAYPASDNFFIRYNFTVDQSTPSLSALSDVSQLIDPYRIDKGNPDLKPYRIYNNVLQLAYHKNTLQVFLGAYHQFYSKVIMADIYKDPEENIIIQTSSNQKYFQTISVFGGANFEIIKDILSVNLHAQMDRFDSKGHDYRHKYTTVSGGGQLNFSLKHWRANLQINSRNNFLWGETIRYGEWWSSAEVGYKYKQLYLGATINNFLTDKWSAGNKNLSRLMPGTSWTYIYDSAPIFCLNLSWNFSWGKRSNAEKKILQNKDSDSGILRVN